MKIYRQLGVVSKLIDYVIKNPDMVSLGTKIDDNA